MSVIFGLAIVTLCSTLVCYSVAKKRRANVPFWVVMAVLIGPFAVPFVFFAKPRAPVVL